MSKSYIQQFQDIKREIGVMANEFANKLAQQAEKDLINAHKQIIDNYYAAHDPLSYNRQEGLYDSIIPQGVEHSEQSKTYNASVRVGSFKMDDHYNATPDIIFDLMWNRGVRGLPKRGVNPLSHSFTFRGNHFEEGQPWINPYWSSSGEPYHNKFFTVVTMNGKTTKKGVPNQVMYDFVTNWDVFSGKNACNEISKEIKNKYK